RSLLHIRCEVVGVGKHPAREMFVTLIITRQNDEFWTELPRPNRGHRRVNAKFPGFIRGRSDYAALLAAHGHGFSAQARVGSLLDGREKGVRVQMDDGLGHGSLASSYEGNHDALNDEFASGYQLGIARILGPQIRL